MCLKGFFEGFRAVCMIVSVVSFFGVSNSGTGHRK